jgi:hypothetical protein
MPSSPSFGNLDDNPIQIVIKLSLQNFEDVPEPERFIVGNIC